MGTPLRGFSGRPLDDRCDDRRSTHSHIGIGGGCVWVNSLGPAPPRRHVALHPGGRPQQQASPRLRHAGRALASAGHRRRRRSALCRDAARLRGPALPHAIAASIRSRWRAPPGNGPATRHVVSGGSTLTMQVARLLEPRAERTIRAKLHQIVARHRARAKAEQSRKSCRSISRSRPMAAISKACARPRSPISARSRRSSRSREAALLVALPQSPETAAAGPLADVARKARDRVLDRIAAGGQLPPDEIAYAKRDAVPNARRPMPALAPHAADQAVAAAPAQKRHQLTIDAHHPEESRGPRPRTRPRARRRACRSPSSRSTMPRGKCWRASLRRIISTSAARARST